ncbi:MAG: hypothetical protein GY737_23130 [Desulfobacteraceae bacterium]|nr:hypothetical protein [Desulfobacteraceae bacterium]
MLIQKWGLAGIWKMEDTASVTAKLIPIMENLSQVGGIKFGETSGRSYLLTRNDKIWMTRTTSPDKPGEILWQQWVNGKPLEMRVEKKAYDFQERLWYRVGLSHSPRNQAAVTWIPPYMFDYDDIPGLSAVMTWPSGKDTAEISVMALDVSINGLFNRISETRVGANGTAFLFDGDTSVYHPVNPERGTGENNRFSSRHTEVEAANVRDAMAAWHAKGKPATAFMFPCGGKAYWAGVQPINADTREFWIGVVAPQSDFLNKVQEKRWAILVVVLGVFALGLLMAGFVVWKYRHQLRDVPNRVIRDAHFANDVRRIISQGEGATLEFKSTMRMNLKSGKNDKNIEVAWMKSVSAFMNTNGGMIVIGVNDDGEAVGTAPDGFENEDKCRLHFRNLMNQHIGPEFAKYIHLSIGAIDGRTVMVVECERVDDPVFLINKKDESFYVRSGPSSLSLTMRQMLKYLESRK